MHKDLGFEFFTTRRKYDQLFGMIKAGDNENLFKERPDVWRNNLAFYLGHTSAFTRCKLKEAGLEIEYHEFDSILERGVSPENPDQISSKQDFPSYKEIYQYVKSFEFEILKLLDQYDIGEEVLYALKLGIEHERLHIQTTVPLISQLNDSCKSEGCWFDKLIFERVNHAFEIYDGGVVRLGVDKSDQFNWDNEIGNKIIEVKPFQVSVYPITMGDVFDFIECGGYEDESFWSQSLDALNWFKNYNNRLPINLEMKEGKLLFKSLHKSIDKIPFGLPASLNAYEADAIAMFLGGRPISEAEFLLLNNGKVSHNIGMLSLRPNPVRTESSFSIGNQAIWTCDDFLPLCSVEEFTEQRLYNGFSSEWFGRNHRVVKGCSFAGSGCVMTNPSFRDFMQNVIGYCATTYVVKT